MEERLMSKEQIIEETIKVLGSIELPMIHIKAIESIHGSIKNLSIVLQMMKSENEVEQNANADAE